MKKKYKITGLDCPVCAKTLENKLNEIKGVNSVKIDFLKSTIEVDSENLDGVMAEVISVAKAIEPEAKIHFETTAQTISKKKTILDITLLALGLIIGVLVLTIPMPVGLYWTLFICSALLMGYKTYYKAIKLLLKGTINENLLVTISIVGATLVGERMDGLMVVGLYSIGKVLESIALNKSKKSIEQLTNLKTDYAVIVRNDEEITVRPEEVNIGDVIIVRPGERVGLDGEVVEGTANLDVQSLTGEALPQSVAIGNEILSGSIVIDGVLKIKVSKKYENSTATRIMDMIENASEKKSKTETVISKMSKWYTLGVIILAVVVWGIVWAITKNFDTAIYRGLIFLVVSCPCAFAISVPLAYFSGIGNASRNGILIKGSNYLDALTTLDTIAMDKTGTLTTGEFEIEKVESLNKRYSDKDIIYIASLGEQYSNHPLAKAIVNNNNQKLESIKGVKEIAGEGVYFDYNQKSYFVGRKSKNIDATVVEIYENDTLLGNIVLRDAIKASSKNACMKLKSMGIKTVMLSGDNDKTAKEVAEYIGLDEWHGKLLPQDKFDWIEENKVNSKIGYVGDGINDAPSLTLADVGISMGLKGSTASIEASDIVIANDNIEKIVDAIKISKYTKKIVWQNIILSAVIKIVFLTLGAVGITGMLSAVIADVGVTVVAILNSLRSLKYNPNKKRSLKKKH